MVVSLTLKILKKLHGKKVQEEGQYLGGGVLKNHN
jgi:hypothetical protein